VGGRAFFWDKNGYNFNRDYANEKGFTLSLSRLSMKTCRIFSLFIVFCGILFLISACSQQNELTIYALKGSPGVALIRLFEEVPRVESCKIKVEALLQADLMAAKFIAGEAKIGILPPNMAAKIAASGRKIQAAAVIGNGMLSLISGDPSIRQIEDLKGKEVELAGQGATPDFVFRKILESRGIKPDMDLRLGYALAHPEIVQALASGRIGLALLPEPFATMALAGNPALVLVGDIQEEWRQLGKGGGGDYPMTVLVLDADFAAANPGLIGSILDRVKASIEWVKANPQEAGILAEKHELGLRAALVRDAIPKSNYVYIPMPEARPGLEALFGAFLDFAPASIGGAQPNEDFYYMMEYQGR
jgi:NitT/TauT family transport system substrate-binding protein